MGMQLGWEVRAALPWEEELCWTRLPRGPLPKKDALMCPGLSFGLGLADVGYFAERWRESRCVCAR